MTIAYHFTSSTLRDGTPIPPIGEALVFEGPIKICSSGYHASKEPFDALKFAPGKWLHKVQCEDIQEEHPDKLVCRKRTILKTIDSEYLLRRFAADQALSVIHFWDAPEVVKEYLETLEESLREAARAAAQAAAQAAAWGAAQAAAWGAALADPGDAARAAAWYAAKDAARDAAQAAARADPGDADCYAAWYAAKDAARDAARKKFNSQVEKAFLAV